MFKQIFETAPIPYRTPEEMPGSGGYNPLLLVPPRIYAETIVGMFYLGLFVNPERTVNGDGTISLFAWNAHINFPGFSISHWKFDGTSGEFIEHGSIGEVVSIFTSPTSITKAFDGNVWATYAGAIREFDPFDYSFQQTLLAAHFGRSDVAPPLVDKGRDLVLMPAEGGDRNVHVYELSTGDFVRTIPINGVVSQLCAEDDKRAYALATNDIVYLFDYTTGEIISAFKCPAPPEHTHLLLAWDRRLRRLLVWAVVPDDTDGACLSITRGYYPVPLATHMTKPIPLIPPRKGREIPVLLRAVGDVAEPLAGVTPIVEATGDATIARAPVATDANGEAIAYLLCNTAGSVVIDAEAEINDGL